MRFASIRCRASLAAMLVLSLTGCGGGGGDDDSLAAASASIKNSFYVKVPRLTYAQVGESSPSGGQKTTLGAVGTTTLAGNTYDSRSISVAGTPVEINKSGPVLCAADCDNPDKVYVGLTVTQGNKTYTIEDDAKPKSGPAHLNELFLIVRTSNGPYPDLQNAHYGSYLTVTEDITIANGDYSVTSDARGTIGHFHGGTSTGSDDMASLKSSAVTANYDGTFNGYMALEGDDLSQGQGDVEGIVRLTADFGAAKVSGNVYAMHSPAGPDPEYGLALNGTITGSHYAGTAQFTDANFGPGAEPVAGYATGEMTGGFYGPGAGETAGAVQIVGNMPTAGGPRPGFVGGSYGAVNMETAPAP